MPDYTYRTVSVTTDPQTITFASLGASLEGRTIPTDLSTAPIVVPVTSEDRQFAITATTTSGFTIDAGQFGGATLPTNISVIVRTFDNVSSVSNAKSATVSRVRRLLKITGTNEILTDAEIQERIDDAVEAYSRHRPCRKRDERIGNSEHEFALPSDWVNDFSTVQFIEYPAGNQPPDYMDPNDYFAETVDTTSRTADSVSSGATSVTLSTAADAGYFKDGELVTIGDDDASETNWVTADGNATTGVVTIKNAAGALYDSNPFIKKKDHLKFKDVEPTSDSTFVIEYTTTHTHTDSSDTIPNNDYELFTWICAEFCALSIAAEFAQHIDNTLGADLINNLGKVQPWMDLAEVYRKKYADHIGIDEDENVTGFLGFIDTDSGFRHGRDYIFHGRNFS